MSLDPPPYIVSLQNNIRARLISWEGAVRAKTITENDLKQIKSVDKVRKEQRKQTIEGDVQTYAKLFFGGDDSQGVFQAAAKREDIIQYLLVLVSDIIDDVPQFTTGLLSHSSDPYAPLLPFIKNASEPSDPIPLLTSVVISSLISHTFDSTLKTPQPIEDAIPKLNSYLSSLANSTDSSLQDIAVQQYSAILRNDRTRDLFWKQKDQNLTPLIDILRAAAGANTSSASSTAGSTQVNGSSTNGGSIYTDTTLRPTSRAGSIRSLDSTAGLSGNVSIQLLYHVLLVLWQLSFSAALVGSTLSHNFNIIALYSQLLKISPKEKLTRLLLSTLSNLLSEQENQDFLLPASISAKLPTLLSNLKSRHLTDKDLLDDLDNLKEKIDEYSKTQTTLSAYAAELQSGSPLRWTPLHRDGGFWAENARAIIQHEKGALVHRLGEILGQKWEQKECLAVACNDVAWLVKEAGEMKKQLEKEGLKGRVMGLMQSEDEGVRYEALRATGFWLRYSFEN